MPSAPPEGLPAPADGRLPTAALAGLGERGFSLYVHVPFCASRCGYCDFNTYTAAELGAAPGASQDAYLAAVLAELDLAGRVLGSVPPVQSVFFGGGTPTMLPAPALGGLLSAIKERFELAPEAEISTEANPESVDAAYLEQLVAAGFNRLSLGMQSARPAVLAVLERRHTPGRVAEVVRQARAAGFGSISLDLIYGAPTESAADWQTSLETALSLSPEHLSAYSLTIEDGTRLAARVARGEVAGIDEDQQADRYQVAEDVLSAAGYANYEISNWALPGQECRHNLAYWRGDDWWGLGPGAHSHVGGVRWWNVRHPRDYTARMAGGLSPAQGREVLSTEERHVERVLLGLRLAEGLDLAELSPVESARLAGPVTDGLVALRAGRVQLTQAGRLLADGVIRRVLDM
ncbi:radical SAM family heme chaperone HemW [Propionicimonas sp.]|uniref:radical SAM family heme chaperone HemW n=1 Tax=Propionicimonas sp. TaxID=1955623 RepID=UPI0017A5210C|nr:radical SAM family heme chaperone HemW [Propionicimonas sp.]MBU3976017.1 radical SAM family heme chaperone HemW [Actinomycetota bacterium]MBA3020831.1 coproporphyrinogen III oxidase [Propionicimonas sp.]MBU3985207.1 radical SAM family heme chaperone HemW [Actinomycetota bacterium]MBU4008197.1 radical SAM family heme chaperone HemW [Actinomycetota bacterium]MBU4064589.1 radical SAM family heme chaperone HemW [Actinomycetota bacterium]